MPGTSDAYGHTLRADQYKQYGWQLVRVAMHGKRAWALLDTVRQQCFPTDVCHWSHRAVQCCPSVPMYPQTISALAEVSSRSTTSCTAVETPYDIVQCDGSTCTALQQENQKQIASLNACSLLALHASSRRGFSTQVQKKKVEPSQSQVVNPKVTTSAPWPWVDITRPYVLPVWVGVSAPAPISVKDAISKVKGDVKASLNGPPNAQLSGRPRKAASPSDSMELTMTFLTDPRKSDQIVRGVVVLPHGSGKAVKIAVFAKGEAAQAAKALGVDVLGDEELIQRIISTDGAAINFDQLIATPEFAKPLARAGRILGPMGLMPNPKMGTLTEDIMGAIKVMQAGRLEFRVGRDKQMQVVVGKASFSDSDLIENITALVRCLIEQRPASLPGSGVQGYISRMYLKSSHTPAVRLDPNSCVIIKDKANDSTTQNKQ